MNTDKITWQSAHVSLSASVCNMCLSIENVFNGDPCQFIREFVKYLVSISMNILLLQEQYAPLFEMLNHAAVPSHGKPHED